MLPGMGKIKDQLSSAQLDEKVFKRQRAIILSMTPQERRNPDVLKASRKKRIAAGSGTKVEDVNRLLKQHRQMADMMKAMGGGKRGGAMGKMASMLGMGGGNPFGGMPGGMAMPSAEEIAALQKAAGGAGGKAPAGMPKLPETPPASLAAKAPKLPGLPGLGGGFKLPGLGGGGFNPLSGKKK